MATMTPTKLAPRIRNKAVNQGWLQISETNLLVNGLVAFAVRRTVEPITEFYTLYGIVDSANAGTWYTKGEKKQVTLFEIQFRTEAELVQFRLAHL